MGGWVLVPGVWLFPFLEDALKSKVFNQYEAFGILIILLFMVETLRDKIQHEKFDDWHYSN